MKTVDTEPTDGWYWWLPKCDLEHRSNPRRWTLVFCCTVNNFGRVGLFHGPVEVPQEALSQ